MKKIRVLHIEFENMIEPYEVPAFRSAIIETAGRENTLFHNHKQGNYRYAYPLIQYKQIRRRPTITCIDEGVDEIHHFFERKQLGLVLGNRPYELVVDKILLNQFNMQVWNTDFEYSIWKWLPLNQKNHQLYKQIDDLRARAEFLEKILTGNILSFAKGIEWDVDKQIRVRIKEIRNTGLIRVKDIPREAFNVYFTSNVFLPNYIGLGRNASLGFGMVKQLKQNSTHAKQQ